MAESTREVTIMAVDPRYPEIAGLLADWARRGLLRPSVWLDTGALRDTADISQLKVRVVDEDPERESPLSDVFGDLEVDRVRLVAVRPVHESAPEPVPLAGLVEFGERLRRETLPADTPFIQINLLVPDGRATTGPDALEPSWTWNAVVSPEDRPKERAVNHGLGRPLKFHGHAAMAAATVAALWRHTSHGALDGYEEQNADEYGRLVVVRPTIRLAAGSHIAEQVVGRLVQVGIASVRPYVTEQYENVAVDGDAERVRALVRAFLPTDDYALDFRPYRGAPLPPPQPSKLTLRELWSALRGFARLRIEQLRQRGRDQAEELVKRWLDAMEENIAQDPDFDPNLPPTPWEIHQLAVGVPALLPSRVPPQRFLWRPLRQLCFSLLDGGPLPQAVADAAGGLAPMLSDPRWIVRSPEEGFTLTDEERRVVTTAGSGAHGVRAADVNAAEHLADALRRMRLSTDLVADERVELDRCQARFDRWRAKDRADSLLGAVAAHVSEELRKARDELRGHKHEMELLEQRRAAALDAIEHHHQRLRLGTRVTWTFLGSAAGFAAMLFLHGLRPWVDAVLDPALLVAAIVALTTAAWTLGRVLLHLAAGIRLHRTLDAIEQERRHLQASVRRWPPEADRLASVYEILTDWAEIVGWQLHRTFGSAGPATRPDEFGRATLPEAFRAGFGGDRVAHLDDLIRRTAKDCFGRGWLTDLYVRLETSVRVRAKLPPDGADPDLSPAVDMLRATDNWTVRPKFRRDPAETDEPDGDGSAPEDPVAGWHARRRLLAEFRDGTCAAEAKDIVVERIWTALRRYPPEELIPTVETGDVGPDGALVHVPTAEFLSDVLPRPAGDEPCSPLIAEGFTPDGLIAEKTQVAKVWLWQPDSLTLEVRPHPGIEVQLDEAGTQRRPDLIQVSRLDVSSQCQPEHLRLFAG
jgi:hypothetical protein